MQKIINMQKVIKWQMFISSVITINENGLNTGIKKQINSMGVF